MLTKSAYSASPNFQSNARPNFPLSTEEKPANKISKKDISEQLKMDKEAYADYLYHQFLSQSFDHPEKAYKLALELKSLSSTINDASQKVKADLLYHIASLNLGFNHHDITSILHIYNNTQALNRSILKTEVEWLTARTLLIYGEPKLATYIIQSPDTTKDNDLPHDLYLHQISTKAHCELANNQLESAKKYAHIILKDSFNDENYRIAILAKLIIGKVEDLAKKRKEAFPYFKEAYNIAAYYNDSIFMLSTLLSEPMLLGSMNSIYEIGKYLNQADFNSFPVREATVKYIQFCLIHNNLEEAIRTFTHINKSAPQILKTSEGLAILELLKKALEKKQNKKEYLDILKIESTALNKSIADKKEVLNSLFKYRLISSVDNHLSQNHFYSDLTKLSLGIGLLLVLSIAILLIYISKNKMKEAIKKQDITKEQLFRLQMNPHFVFNVLVAIQNSIYNDSIAETNRLINSFSRLMMTFLHLNETKSITLELEIDTIRQYLFIQSLRFHEQFTYRIHIDPRINPTLISIAPMLTQPFIENAIEHGLARSANPGIIEIFYTLYNKQMLIEIFDNGVGLKSTSNSQRGDHMSMAKHLTTERIRLLNKGSFRKEASFYIQDLKESNKNKSGTKVVFMVPYTVIKPAIKTN